ncbi:hypothetical protein [Phenylobacterium sp.]|jgi:hypothetical protein|uniref:hypothetical protein n=1 Tax=Phenylobacterium sp. TaxID=1871053 RepID=UPI002F95986C
MPLRRPTFWSLISAFAAVVLGAYAVAGAALLLNPPSLELAQQPPVVLAQLAGAVVAVSVGVNP